jgi:uncharacterized protein (DUF433 family)
MNWHDYIASDPEILGGKPAIRGTRLSVEFILGLLSEGWTQEEMLAEYPRLTPDAIHAVFAFAAEVLGEEALYAFPTSA